MQRCRYSGSARKGFGEQVFQILRSAGVRMAKLPAMQVLYGSVESLSNRGRCAVYAAPLRRDGQSVWPRAG